MKTIFPSWNVYLNCYESHNSLLFFSGFYRKILNIDYIESNIPGVYGGLLIESDNLINIDSFDNYLKANQYKIIYSPYVKNHNMPSNGKLETSIINLTQDNFLNKINKNHLASIKKAENSNLEFSYVDSLDDIDRYYSLYKLSLRRWGLRAMGYYPKSLFYELFKSKCYGEQIKLWKIMLNNRIIAGCWTLKKDNIVNYWHACYNHQYNHFSPTHYLIYQLMIFYKNLDVKYLDLGPSAGLENLKFFKMRFGSENKTIPTYNYIGKSLKFYNLYLHYAEKIFRKNKYSI